MASHSWSRISLFLNVAPLRAGTDRCSGYCHPLISWVLLAQRCSFAGKRATSDRGVHGRYESYAAGMKMGKDGFP
eukprot:90765-Rhodomonas_salina.2